MASPYPVGLLASGSAFVPNFSHANMSQPRLGLQVVINALSPERLLGEDRQLSVVPSITHVYVSNDLQVGVAGIWHDYDFAQGRFQGLL